MYAHGLDPVFKFFRHRFEKSSMTEINIHNSDRLLVVALIQSDESAFKQLYYRYFETIFSYLWRQTRNEETAKELTQELFIKIWNHRENLDENKSFKAYLYRTASNLAIDHLRSKITRQNIFSDKVENEPAVEMDEFFEFRERLEKALKKMPKEQSKVFTLNRFEGLKYSEIAEVLQISVKTVEGRMTKVLKVLRGQLKDLCS